MNRAERRHRTNRVATRQMSYWMLRMGSFSTEKPEYGRFRKRKAFACGCSDHNGMCHATKTGDVARVERRQERQDIDAMIESYMSTGSDE